MPPEEVRLYGNCSITGRAKCWAIGRRARRTGPGNGAAEARHTDAQASALRGASAPRGWLGRPGTPRQGLLKAKNRRSARIRVGSDYGSATGDANMNKRGQTRALEQEPDQATEKRCSGVWLG